MKSMNYEATYYFNFNQKKNQLTAQSVFWEC